MIIHEDTRRIIYDWVQGNFKSAKAVVVKEEIAIGDHYHIHRDEHFFLLEGEFKEIVLGESVMTNIPAPYYIKIEKGTYHRFVCTKGSILLGVATELYNEYDEVKP